MNQSIDNLPDLSGEYPLTEAQIQQFRRDGHILLRQVCTREEIAAYRPVIVETAMHINQEKRPLSERDTYGKAFLQTLYLRKHSEGVKKFALCRRFAQIVADLHGIDAVRIYHEQALFKEPGGGHTPWHQDQTYWPLITNKAMGMWMPLVDVPLEMGPIRFASGSHVNGQLGVFGIDETGDQDYLKYIRQNNYPIVQYSVNAGDATFHNAWTVHGAGANRTGKMREAMVVTFFPDGTIVDEFTHPSRVNDAKHFMGGKKPGEVADADINTIVYRRQ